MKFVDDDDDDDEVSLQQMPEVRIIIAVNTVKRCKRFSITDTIYWVQI